MARILTGIQSTGTPHLGNLLGAIIPAIELSKEDKNESLFFIADLHSFTTIRDPKVLKENTYATAAAWCSVALYPAFSAKTKAFGEEDPKNISGFLKDVGNEYKLAITPRYWRGRAGKVGALLAVNMLCDGVIYDYFSQNTKQEDEAQ